MIIKFFRLKLNTIDVDDKDPENLRRISSAVEKCPRLVALEVKPSSAKGYHLTLWCLKDCEECRKLYDDKVRYEMDQMRPVYCRDVLFSKKYLQTEDLNNSSLKDKTMVKLKTRPALTTELEEGLYFAKLVSVEEIATTIGPALRWTFEVDGQMVSGITSTSTSPASKLRRWFAALGGTVESGEIDTDTVLNRPCQVRITHRPGRFGGTRFPNVIDVLPPPAELRKK